MISRTRSQCKSYLNSHSLTPFGNITLCPPPLPPDVLPTDLMKTIVKNPRTSKGQYTFPILLLNGDNVSST